MEEQEKQGNKKEAQKDSTLQQSSKSILNKIRGLQDWEVDSTMSG